MAEARKAKYQSNPSRPIHGGPGASGGYQRPKNMGKTLSRLLGYITNRKWLLVVVFLCVIVSSAASVAGTYLIRPVLNELVSDLPAAEKLAKLARTLGAMLGIYLFGAACTCRKTLRAERVCFVRRRRTKRALRPQARTKANRAKRGS